MLLSSGGLQAQEAERVRMHTEFLASDELKGRGTGTEGANRAAEYIAGQFKELGLEAGPGGSYYQEVIISAKDITDRNVVAVIPAADTTNGSVVFMAHYDGLGVQKVPEKQDSIYNGARDNAVGVAVLIELARKYKNEARPGYNLVFVATTAEEIGAYGSAAYLDAPVFSKEEIILCLNIDGFNVSGQREDYFVMPRQGVNFVEDIQEILKPLGWVYSSPDWVDGMNDKFDTVSFLREGIPALTLWTGNRLKGGGEAPNLPLGDIHSPSDEINEYWNWEGVSDHLRAYKTIADYYMNNPHKIRVTDSRLFQSR